MSLEIHCFPSSTPAVISRLGLFMVLHVTWNAHSYCLLWSLIDCSSSITTLKGSRVVLIGPIDETSVGNFLQLTVFSMSSLSDWLFLSISISLLNFSPVSQLFFLKSHSAVCVLSQELMLFDFPEHTSNLKFMV